MILAVLLACASDPAAVQSPAVIVIVADTLRADLGGAPLPAWWKEGREYTHAYAAAPWTSSAAVTISTGRYPVTLEEQSPPSGVSFGCDGERTPLGVLPRTWPADAWPTLLLTDQPAVQQLHRGERTIPFRGPGSEELVAEAIEVLYDPGTGPALLVWSVGAHEPYDGLLPGPGYPVSSVQSGQTKQRRCGDLDAEHAAWTRLQYRSAAEHALAGLAPLIGAARASGATVFFTADHGEALGELALTTGLPTWGHATGLHDAQVHVPLYLWGPGVEPGTDARPVPATCIGQTVRAILDGYLAPGACDLRSGLGLDGIEVVSGMLLPGNVWDERVILNPVVAGDAADGGSKE